MGSGGRRSAKGGVSNTGGSANITFNDMDVNAQNSMLANQRQLATGASRKAIV